MFQYDVRPSRFFHFPLLPPFERTVLTIRCMRSLESWRVLRHFGVFGPLSRLFRA
jgi:hypothetical protein